MSKTGADLQQKLFFAIFPPQAALASLEAIQSGLALPGRPVMPGKMHVTLAFLGMQPASRIPRLVRQASRQRVPAIDIEWDCVGSFPQAGVVWLGCRHPPASLIEFRRCLVASLQELGISVDQRCWTPHITLYRNLRIGLEILLSEPVRWTIDGFVLVESRAGAAGSSYLRLADWQAGPGREL